jgi:uncharacterized protein
MPSQQGSSTDLFFGAAITWVSCSLWPRVVQRPVGLALSSLLTDGVEMIIDSHCHAGTGDGLTGPWDSAASLQNYMHRAARAGIDRTVLFATFHSDYSRANREVARIVRSRPDRFLGFAFVHPTRDRGRIQTLVTEAINRHGFCGIKVHRHDARITREVCEVARLYGLPVLYDVMGEVSIAEILGIEYPDVPFIIPHLGSFSDDWSSQLALIDHLFRHPNIFTDTAGVRRFDLLQRAVQRAGPNKILFGSDGPWLHPGVELEKIRALHLDTRAEDLILGGNFLRLTSQVRARTARVVVAPAGSIPTVNEYRDPWRPDSNLGELHGTLEHLRPKGP